MTVENLAVLLRAREAELSAIYENVPGIVFYIAVEPVDLAKFLQHVTGVTQSTRLERGQEMILRLPAEVVRFMADEARLEQIAINLLSNASKYTAQGGTIEFSGSREGFEVILRCKDNGRGIPLEMQEKIFEPFTRVEPLSDSRGEASLGIGLALVKQLV